MSASSPKPAEVASDAHEADNGGIPIESTTLKVSGGVQCALHKWSPPPPSSNTGGRNDRGVAVVYHGFAAHARYPTVRYVSDLLATRGFTVYSLDFPGHGSSPGTRGLMTSVDSLVDDGLCVALHAVEKHPDLPLFLVGSSMGGAIALAVSKRMKAEGGEEVAGVVMLAPLLSLNVSGIEHAALKALAFVAPSAALISNSATSNEKQYRDPKRRAEAEADELTYKGKLRCASALTCVELAVRTRESLDGVTCPFLCMVGNEDVVVDNAAAEELMAKAQSSDKTLKRYDALHGLMCEPQPLLGQIEEDITKWVVERSER